MAAHTAQARLLTDAELIARSSTAPDAFHELFDSCSIPVPPR